MSKISFNGIEHAAASALHDVHVAIQWIEKEVPKIEGAEPMAEAITSAVAPQYTLLVRSAFACLGVVVGMIATGDKAAQEAAKLDPAFIADIQGVMTSFKTELAAVGIKA